MADQAILHAQKRDGTGKGVARKLRQSGRVPAVLYGRDLDSVHLSVDAREAEHLFHAISVDNTIVDLTVEGEKEAFQTLVREIQTHPWKATLVHIDFLRIQAGVAVDVDVPVNLVGVPEGVKMDGGVLEQIIHDLPVRCIPSKIPEALDLDISEMNIGDSVTVADLVVPEDVEMLTDTAATIISVVPPAVIKVEEEVVEEVEGEVVVEEEAEPEVVGRGKPAEEETTEEGQ